MLQIQEQESGTDKKTIAQSVLTKGQFKYETRRLHMFLGGNSLAYDRRFHLVQLEKARAEELDKARNTDVGSAGLSASHINNRASFYRVAKPDPIVNLKILAVAERSAGIVYPVF